MSSEHAIQLTEDLTLAASLPLIKARIAKLEGRTAASPSDDGLRLALARAFRQADQLDKAYDAYTQMDDIPAQDRPVFNSLARQFEGPQMPLARTYETSLHAAPFVILDDFLPPDQALDVLQYAQAHQTDFEPRGASMADDPTPHASQRIDLPYRASYHMPHRNWPHRRAIGDRISRSLPQLCAGCLCPDLARPKFEATLTWHGEGGFFNLHKDTANIPQDWVRTISFMLYLQTEPKPYQGGDLLIFDTAPLMRDGYAVHQFTRIMPRHNRLVAIASHYYHAVSPVRMAGLDFAAGRFGITGHIRRPWDDLAARRVNGNARGKANRCSE